MALSKSEASVYEKKLLKIEAELSSELKKLKDDLNMGSDTEGSSYEEESDEAEQFSNYLPLKKQLTERLEAVSLALLRINNGTYGMCSSCNGAIEPAVLEAAPESSLCFACKKAQ